MISVGSEYLAYEAMKIGATPAIRVTIGDTVIAWGDIEQAGSVTLEAPKAFDDLVAGAHSGLLLNNRQGSFDDDLIWTPAPLYSPNKSSFIFAGEEWYDKLLKIELGWAKGGWLEAGFIEDAWLSGDFTEFITLFLGKIKKWGPVSRAVDQDGAMQPNTVEVYAVDWIMDCLQKRIALPAADGSPNPLTYGEFLVEAKEVVGWTPAPLIREATFEGNNLSELDSVVESGGGDVSVISPGMEIGSTYCMRTATTGANQDAYGTISLPTNGEIFISGSINFTQIPSTTYLADYNMFLFEIVDSVGWIFMRTHFNVYGELVISYPSYGGAYTGTSFNVKSIVQGVPLTWAIWVSNVLYSGPDRVFVTIFMNGEKVYENNPVGTDIHPRTLNFGVQTQGTAESWTVDFDNVKLFDTYYPSAYQVQGYPFDDISGVYVKDVSQPDTTVMDFDGDTYDVTLTKLPGSGIVSFYAVFIGTSIQNPKFRIEDTVIFRVVEHAGGRHPLEMITMLLEEAGVSDYIDPIALAAAYLAVPDDKFNARFEGGGSRDVFSLPEFGSLGMPIADALKEITSRALYWVFVDAGLIKIIPYTGTPPASPALALTSANLYECTQTIDLESMNAFVTALYGWNARNPTFWYAAGDRTAGGQGTGLDYTWDSPVACEDRTVVMAKVDLLLKFLSAQERLEPVRLNLTGARLELMEAVSVDDVLLGDAAQNYWVTRKEIGLDPGSRETNLQLMSFLGE